MVPKPKFDERLYSTVLSIIRLKFLYVPKTNITQKVQFKKKQVSLRNPAIKRIVNKARNLRYTGHSYHDFDS